MKADEIAIDTANTGMVTVVVTVMSILSKKDASCGALISKMRSLLAKMRKESFSEENTHGLRSFSQKSRKGRIPKT
jgi:hypothetical protein